jgi:flagellar hook-length control protein FliK
MALPLSDAVPGVDAVPGALPSAGPTPSAPVAAGGAPAAPTFGPVAQIAPLAIAIATDPGSGTTDIALSPDELGRLQMQVVTDGDTLRIAMLVERPETLDLLRRHAEQLLSDLRQAGFGSATLSFGQGGGAAMEGASEPRTLAGGAAPATVPDILPAPLRPPLAGNGTLDLRL